MIFTNEDLEKIPFTSKKYANQKSMYIHKTDSDKDHIYSLINQEAHMRALDDFGWSAAYNLWVYLCCNQDGYIEDFSPTHLGELVHKGRKTIQRAAKDLEDKGYLVRVGENDYIFFENPDDNGCVIDDTSFKRCVTHDTGLEGCVTDDTGLNLQENKGVSPMTHCVSPMTQGCVTGVYSNIINSIDNIKDNIKFSPHDNSTKVDYHFEENLSHGESVITKCNNETCDTGATSLVYTSRTDGKNDNMDKVVHVDKVVQVGSSSAHVLSKDELRPIHTSDGAVVELPIRNILDGLKDALTNKKNESTIKEIREKCDLTEKQKKEIDDTLDFWELDW